MIASSQSISSAQTWRAMLALFIFKVKFIEKVRWLLTFEIIMYETEKKKIFEAKRLAPACVPRQPETPPLLLATTHPAASTTFPEPHTFNQHLLSHLQVATKCFIAFCCVILPSCTHSQRGVEYAVVH